MRDNGPLLEHMLQDESRQSALYRPGPYWLGYQRTKIAELKKSSITEFRANGILGKGFADPPVIDPSIFWLKRSRTKTWLKRQLIRAPIYNRIFADYQMVIDFLGREMRHFRSSYYQLNFGQWLANVEAEFDLPQTTHGGCVETVIVNEKEYSYYYVDQLIKIMNYRERINFDSIHTMIEIGGGFGANIHLLLSMFPGIRKVIYIDIPPMIYIATEYLRNFFGSAIHDYGETCEKGRLEFKDDDSREILCLCPWQIESFFCKATLFWNSSSFSEMPPEIVQNYATHIVRNMAISDASLCLTMSDTTASHRTSSYDVIEKAFAPSFDFEMFDPAIEHEKHRQYAVSRRHPNSRMS